MKARFGWKNLDTFDLEMIDPEGNSITDHAGRPFIVTLLNPRAETMREIYRKHEEEFARFKARLPMSQRQNAERPKDMVKRQANEIVQAAHVAWKNAPVYKDDGEPSDATQINDPDFMSEAFAEFMEAEDIYTVQITRALNDQKNFMEKATETAPRKNSSPSAKGK